MVDNVSQRADRCIVTEIISDSYSRPVTVEKDVKPTRIFPEDVNNMEYAELEEIFWEYYDGVHGPNTLLKDVEYSTAKCPECGTMGRHDEAGDVVCDDPECGCVISNKPTMLPVKGAGQGTGANPSYKKRSLRAPVTAEPDVQ